MSTSIPVPISIVEDLQLGNLGLYRVKFVFGSCHLHDVGLPARQPTMRTGGIPEVPSHFRIDPFLPLNALDDEVDVH